MEYDSRSIEYRKKILIDQLIPPSRSILDLGSGNGAYFSPLKKKADFIVGIDISSHLCRRSKSENSKCFVVNGDITCLPFRDKVFDGVWASEVLEHSSFEAFRELRRVVKDWFIATMPNPYSLNYKSDASHVLKYSINSLQHYFKSWANWQVWIRGIGLELSGTRISIPTFLKRLSIILTWYFPFFSPTFCIMGRSSQIKPSSNNDPRLFKIVR
jgi:SAM-dependent methyltransferase